MRWVVILCVLIGRALPVAAENDHAGEFDYYVLSLSWSPNWCALEGDARNSSQCDASRDFGWILHGLWPQYQTGWPSHCHSPYPQPTRAMTRDMANIMGTSGLAWYQWKKHGTCSGLTASDYYATARRAFEAVNRPAVFRKLTKPVRLPAQVVEQAFLEANPGWEPDMLTITCSEGRIQEARLCLSKDLDPVPCGRDVVRDCTLGNAVFDPIRQIEN
ncbi:ribonuclease T2 [Lutimaribacter sp. EGI FJ00015]|uniref:Ribonuclease T2 n=1 Tax=Lutimaribacter degradans TaxID=2945989 RepID=A0ACC5ZWY4_9RHOB|nr:ribonuclease T2 [Lutimaribacter sp. EGI FJ00013]MCM2562802.1 ribonuclease T2 [Lutimaribacter sp. EGI FJ00013]MCO0613959.1 ribonuclease T2 [Lutimaribacter sp. EGI FJ00015]MCO0636931.1 ribonuclease T2 [Lutimaribacter sp. EGI FJ00014]